MTLPSIDDTDFAAQAERRSDVLLATLSGNADLNARLALERFLASVHEETDEQELRKVVVDLRQLAFMSSSCLKCLVVWMTRIQALPPTRRYRVTFLSSPDRYWQGRSLRAISSLAPEIVTIES